MKLNNKILSKSVLSTDFRNLNEKSKSSKLNNRIIPGTVLQQDQKNLVAKIENKTQREITAALLDPKMLDAFLNTVNPYLISQKEVRITAAVAKSRYRIATKNQTKQRLGQGVTPATQSLKFC